MIARIVAWSARHSWVVIALALVLGLCGELARRSLPYDVVPDLGDPQIGVLVDWMGHSATDVAASVTRLLTAALDDVPGSTAVRGSSMSGMAYVDVVFAPRASLEVGRRTITERIDGIRDRLPPHVRVKIGPAASSSAWVFEYAVMDRSSLESAVSPSILRQLQETVLRPALETIPGVAEVGTVGGHPREILVEARADELRARGMAFSDVSSALQEALERHDHAGLQDLQGAPVAIAGATGDTPPLNDVARVQVQEDMPVGLAEFGGNREAVGGIVLARRGADPITVIGAVKRALDRERAHLPESVEIVTVYDRSELAKRAQETLTLALAEEVAAVVFVIALFLLHGPSALVPLLTLPIVLSITFAAMWILRLPATVMSLGGIGIALGMAVDADIVALEACHRRLEASVSRGRADRRGTLIDAAGSFAPAILTAFVITGIAFLPILAFPGETGRLLRPLALTKTLVVASASIVTLTVAPAVRDRLLIGRVTPEFDNPVTRRLVALYRPFVHFALSRPALTLATGALAIASSIPLLTRLGGEFLPRIDEGDLLFMPTTLPGVTIEHAASQVRKQDAILGAFEEVETVFGKVGRADTATDTAPVSMVETTIRLRPRSRWPRRVRDRWYSAWAPPAVKAVLGTIWPETTAETLAELVDKLDRAARLPGWTSAWTAPARARIDMMSTGIRTPVGIRIVAASPGRLSVLGTALGSLALRVPGVRSAVFESQGAETWLHFEPDPGAEALLGVDPEVVGRTADLLLTGGQVGEIERDGEPVRVRVASDLPIRGPADRLREATVRAARAVGDGPPPPVPLGLLGRTTFVSHPAMLRTEGGALTAYVLVDLTSGVDPVRTVERGQRQLELALRRAELRLDPGERIEWTGQYPLFAVGERRLRWIAPLMLLAMLGLLFLQFRNWTEALLVLASVPFALVGSVWTLFLLGYALSPPVWVGLLSVIGLAMQTGVVMVVYIDESFHRRVREGAVHTREDVVAAHAEGTVRRLRPKVMTIGTMAVGLLPLVWTDGPGSEIMRRVAAPMVGGLATSAFLTLEVLPVLYTIWRCRQLRRAQRTGVPIGRIVGTVPAWARR